MQRRLGDRGGLIEEYFCCLLEAVGSVPLHTAAETGFNAGIELRTLCKSVVQGETDHAQHLLYEKAREYISAHPFSGQAIYARHPFYYVALSGDFAEYALDEYARTIKETINEAADLVRVNELYRMICEALGGEDEMERFAQMNLLLASTIPLYYEDFSKLRRKAVQLVNNSRGYVPLKTAKQNQVGLAVKDEKDEDDINDYF